MSAAAVTRARPMPERPGEHLPDRPFWDCRKCGQTWPYDNAKTDLLVEYLANPSALQIYLALLKWEGFDDYAAFGSLPADLADRFSGWAR